MSIKVEVYGEYWPDLGDLTCEGFEDDYSVHPVTRAVKLIDLIDLDRLALVIPTALWPQGLRDRYDRR